MRLFRPPIPFTDVSVHSVLSQNTWAQLWPFRYPLLATCPNWITLKMRVIFCCCFASCSIPFVQNYLLLRFTRINTTSCRNTHFAARWKLVNEGQPVCISAESPTHRHSSFFSCCGGKTYFTPFPSNRRRFHQGPSITNARVPRVRSRPSLECQPFPAPINHFPNLRRVVSWSDTR